MKKLLLLILFFPSIIYANSWVQTVSWSAISWEVQCWTTFSHWITHIWIPDVPWLTIPASSASCNTHSYYPASDHSITVTWNNWWITNCPAWERFVSITPSPCTWWSCTMVCRQYDDIAPTLSATNSTTTRKNADIDIDFATADSWWSTWSSALYNWWSAPSALCDSGWAWNFSNSSSITDSVEWAKVLYLCSKDVSWNISTWSGNYRLDRTNPIVWYNISWWTTFTDTRSSTWVTASITCDDWVLSWCNAWTYQYREESSDFVCDSSWTWTSQPSKSYSAEWITYVCFRAMDNAWNWYVYSTVAIIKIDTTIPIVTWNNSSLLRKNYNETITMNASDSWWSALAWSLYNWNAAPNAWCTGGWTPFVDWQQLVTSHNWAYVLYLCARDTWWNVKTWSWHYRIDRVNPSVSANLASTTIRRNTNINITLSSSDWHSWVNQSRYSFTAWDLDATCTSWWIPFAAPTTPYTDTTEWIEILYMCNRDNAWNTRTWSWTYKLDKTPPIANNDYTPTWFDWVWNSASTRTITLSWSDNLSWIAYYKWCEWTTCAPSITWSSWDLITKNSVYNNTIKYQAWDFAWNTWAIESFVLKLNWPIVYNKVKDNDSNARSTIVWYVTKTWSLENIFWNNQISSDYINKNINNNDNAYVKIWNVTSWNIRLSLDKDSTIRVVKFNKNKYSLNKELFIEDSFEWTVTAQSWYINKNLTNNSISLSWSVWSSAYNFDFTNNDYAIFVKNNWTGTLNYKITWISWIKWVYINPINDSYPKEIRILSSHIIISNWVYVWKQSEYIKLK